MSRPRSFALVAAVVGLLAIVAVAALGRPLGKTGGGGGGLPQTFWNVVFTTLLLLAVLALVAALVGLLFIRRERLEVAMKPFTTRTARALAVVIALAAIATFIRFQLHGLFNHHPSTQTSPALTTPNAPPPSGSPLARHTRLVWPEIIVVLGALLALALVYRSRWRSLPSPRAESVPPEELMVALDESLDDLRGDPDLRRAIVAAYARMERALAAAGVPRDPAETPLEYLERVLLSLDTSAESVRRLTDLFEWARFSHHEPEPRMRDDAIDALVAVRDELRAREPVAAW